MHKVKIKAAPAVFLPKFQKPAHPYLTNFFRLNYIKPISQLSRSEYRILEVQPLEVQPFGMSFQQTVKRKSKFYHSSEVK